MEKSGTEKIKKIACGAAVGLASSVFGGGGGMIAVPMLRGLGLEEKQAHATAILLIFPVSVLAFCLYAAQGIYDFNVLLPTAIGVAAGGGLGASLLGKLPVRTVGLIFAFLQLVAGISLFFF